MWYDTICIEFNNRKVTLWCRYTCDQIIKNSKGMVITKVRIVVTSDREKQAEGIGEEHMGRYITANILLCWAVNPWVLLCRQAS